MTYSRHHSFGILMYHRVAPRTPGASKPTWNVTPRHFHRQLQGLLSRGYWAWPLRRVLECRRTGTPIPPKVFVVTFDDGYQSVFLNAWPILKELSVPATVFLITSYLDASGPFPFDDWKDAGKANTPPSTWKPLTVDECAAMREGGLIEFGSHTHSHFDFRRDDARFRQDLAQSQRFLKERLGLDRAPFAFPFGFFNNDMVQTVRRSGLSCALTCEMELVRPSDDPYSWGRFNVQGGDTASTLNLKLNGFYSMIRKPWKLLKNHLKLTAAVHEPCKTIGDSCPKSP